MAKGKSTMNLEENVASALCYVLIWLTGIIFFFMEKENNGKISCNAINSDVYSIVHSWLDPWVDRST